jgi:NAD(P)-dependent dehydrogenase (short-subunit alcohol dehydrogenase family)
MGHAGVMTEHDVHNTVGTTVITGAAGGMGRACVRAFQGSGPLLLVDIDEARTAEVADAANAEGGSARALVVDVSRPADIEMLAKEVAADGGLRRLIHTAGVSPTMADAATVLDVDLVGTARLTAALLPLAVPGSVVVCVASIGGQMGPLPAEVEEALSDPLAPDFQARMEAASSTPLEPGGAYAMAKRGVIKLCEREASAWGARGGRIVSISPGIMDTPMGRLEAEENEAMAFMLGLTPVSRPPDGGFPTLPGRVDDIANAAAFLCSPAASFISGTDLRIDGGLVAALFNPAAS